MITETLIFILLAVAVSCIFLTFQYQSVMSGSLGALLLILIGSYFLIGGISQAVGTSETSASSSITVLGITTQNITTTETNTYTTERNIPLGLLFFTIGSFLIWEIYRFRKETQEATHDRL